MQRFADLTLSTDASGNYLIGCNGLAFKLNANLDFSGVDFAGIGTDSTVFKGTFLGDDNYSISNLTTCVFNNIGDGANISGLKVYNSTIQKSCGIIVDKMSGGSITDCTVKGGGVAIFAEGSYAGGIVGNGTGGTVSNCNVLDLGFLAISCNVVVGTGSTQVSGCKFANVGSSFDIINTVGGTDGGNNVEYYGLPEGLTAQGDNLTVDGATYCKAGATFIVDANAAGYEKITKINGATANGDGSYTITGNVTLEGYPKIDGFTFNDAGNCYEISDAQDLVNLADYVDDGNDCKGLTFKLTNDIDLSAIENFTPIGYVSSSDSYPFAGTFDGDNHTISNLTISTSYYQAGLFGYVSGGTVQNVKLFNANVTGGNGTTGNRVGGLVGELIGSVINCTLGGTVNISRSGVGYAGGLVGFLDTDSTIDGVLIDGATINLPDTSAGAVLGYIYNNQRYTLSNIYYHDFSGTVVTNDDITATTVYALNLPQGVKASGGDGYKVTISGVDFYKSGATVTLTLPTLKTGYSSFSLNAESVTFEDSDITVSGTATLDTANHYAFDNGDGYTLATNANTTAYPDLIQVYEVRLPENVTASGDVVITDGGKTYAAAGTQITLSAANENYELDSVKINGVALDGNTFTVGTADVNITADITAIVTENNEFNNADSTKATAVTVGGSSGDFGIQLDDGKEQYTGLYSITASKENSTLVGNAKANKIIVAGGGTNILTGGLGNDTFDFESGGGIVTDYGIGSTKDGANKVLAKTATQKATSTYLAYDRTDPDSYARGADVIKVDGKVTGVYFDKHANASSKKDATFTAIITYDATPNDDTDADQIIVLKDMAKKPTKTNATNESKRIYQTNDVAAATLKIWDTSTGNQRLLSSTNLNKLFYDDDALTSELDGIIQQKVDYLINISEGKTPENNPFDITPAPTDGEEIGGVEDD